MSIARYFNEMLDPSMNWDDVAEMVRMWDGQVLHQGRYVDRRCQAGQASTSAARALSCRTMAAGSWTVHEPRLKQIAFSRRLSNFSKCDLLRCRGLISQFALSRKSAAQVSPREFVLPSSPWIGSDPNFKNLGRKVQCERIIKFMKNISGDAKSRKTPIPAYY